MRRSRFGNCSRAVPANTPRSPPTVKFVPLPAIRTARTLSFSAIWVAASARSAAEMAADLAEAATQIAENDSVRAVLIAGSGTNFTVGGDLGVFAGTAREQLPK